MLAFIIKVYAYYKTHPYRVQPRKYEEFLGVGQTSLKAKTV